MNYIKQINGFWNWVLLNGISQGEMVLYMAVLHAVILPKFPMVSEYLLEALNRCADEFMFKYVGSNINIQIETFKYFMIDWHDDLDTQRFIAAFSQTMDKALEQSDSERKHIENLKKYMLANLMA